MGARVLVFVAQDATPGVIEALTRGGLEVVRAAEVADAHAVLSSDPAGAVVDLALGDPAWAVARAAACPVLLLHGPDTRSGALAALGREAADLCARDAVDEIAPRIARLADRTGRDSDRLRALGLVVHDINNPLAAIRILAEMLEADLEDETQRRDLHDVLEAVDVAAAIAESLGAMLRLERGHRPLALAPTDLREIARKVAERPCYLQHVAIAPGPPTVAEIDGEAVSQALSDLCLTARRLAPEGVQVQLAIEPPATLICTAPGAIPAALVGRLVEPYGSVDARSQRVQVGALGLAYARWVAVRHGGGFEVRGEPSFEARLRLA